MSDEKQIDDGNSSNKKSKKAKVVALAKAVKAAIEDDNTAEVVAKEVEVVEKQVAKKVEVVAKKVEVVAKEVEVVGKQVAKEVEIVGKQVAKEVEVVAKKAAKPVADDPDGKIVKVIESIPVAGYAIAAAHAVNGDDDRCQRAAAKCTASTAAAAVTIATGGAAAAVAGPGLAVAVTAGAVGGAAGGAVGVFSESQIAKGIKDEEIKKQCKSGTAKEYAGAIAMGGAKGALGGGMGAAVSGADNLIDAAEIAHGLSKKEEKENDQEEKYDGTDYWEYDPQKMDKIYIMTGQGQKYICCDKSGRINCDKQGKNGTIFESIPHKKDESKVALKSNGYYLFIDESNKKDPVKTSKEIYYFKVLSHSNSKFSFVSQNGHYLYFKKGGFGKGYKILTKLKKEIKLAEIKFFVSNASK